MKELKMIFSLLVVLLMFSGCDGDEDDLQLESMVVPTNIQIDTDISTDGSGIVVFDVSADNAITYKFNFGDETTGTSLDGTYTKRYSRNGLNTYQVLVVAYGKGGISSSKRIEISVESDFSDPETKEFLTGGSSKMWYVAAFQPGHLGVGPSSGDGFDSPIYYSAAPFEKAGAEASACFYTDVLTFSTTGENNFTYNLNNNGATFFNVDYVGQFGGPTGSGDQCIAYDTGGEKTVTLSPATSGIESSTGTVMDFSDGGFMSYYIGTSTYEILDIDENSMYVRAIMGNNPALAWYLKFTTTPYDQQQESGNGGEEEAEFETQFNNLVWSDEFDGDSLDTDSWNFETGNGTNGWGNNELQYYLQDNVTVQDGSLFITAKRESESGFDFTSGRITTQDKYEFTYGRVEARIKLPEGVGTWPAFWMLGANFDGVGWPETGEIDILEWVGKEPGRIQSALHFPGNSGGNAVVGPSTIENPSSEFHTYTAEWTEDAITFLLDGEVYFTFDNDSDKPFNKDFFLILNVAMGGNLGGDVDPAFSESAMEIDYVKVYQ
ncbi:family 16 glycosylhydrolase [Christiangramia flava]|uniref:Beta-glucanase n=1 Tax=Christiangramia flava JLT2011 TaxID=1229726 RepID=A0A1L7I552_9FLAO|nr:family 16 glycosylhydrolase [Christiangramia flava]APU68293.1 Beta-glucanase precursor [Christiangramia flava JLT2011]OSS40920.1 Glucanase A [Christiangramia flava JLT2011]